jgi:hypothetical protein
MIKTTESFYILCYLLELIIKNLANFGKSFHGNPLYWSKSYFQDEIWQKFANNKTLALPQCAFQVQKVNFIAWQSSKLGQSEPAPTRAPCLGWVACGIDNGLVYTSVALFLGLDIKNKWKPIWF